MRVTAKLLALMLTLALAVPAAALAQSAGDDQYVDPFEGQGGGQQNDNQGGGGGGSQDDGQDDGSAQTAPTTSADEAAGTVAQSDTTTPTLPRTGLPLIGIGVAGLVLLSAGYTLRRRA